MIFQSSKKGALHLNENIKLFLEKMAEDQELQTRFSQIHDPDEAYALASSIQPGFTKEELIETMSAIRDAMEEDLTDEDMAKSAGGESDEVKVSVFLSVTSAFSGAVTVTAAAASAI